MSNTIDPKLDQIHFNSPQNCFEHMPKFFDKEKSEFLCMILKNKMTTVRLNKIFFWFKKWNKHSNHLLRVKADEGLCERFGPERYHSYGRGWCEKCFKGPVGFEGEKIYHIMNGNTKEKKVDYINPIPPEYKIISKYKFNFCPENSRFNGYVTEKPIQAMACGTIPIYCGAPDVYNYLEEKTFINTDEYSSRDLCDLIWNMDGATYRDYKERIKRFLTSHQSDNFSSHIFAHAPQPTQASVSIIALSSFTVIAFVGQKLTQLPQAVHLFSSTSIFSILNFLWGTLRSLILYSTSSSTSEVLSITCMHLTGHV